MEVEVPLQGNYFDPTTGEMDILQYFAGDFDASPGVVVVESSHSSPNSGVFNSDQEHDSDSESGNYQTYNTYMQDQLPTQGTILATQTLEGIQAGPFYDIPVGSPTSSLAESTDKKKRGRKRRRTDEGSIEVTGDEQEDVSYVALNREELLEISSRELEERAKRLAAARPLTAAEQREIKRQRRLIKNREYAQASRLKKKGNMSEINGRMQQLEDENELLKQQVAMLQARCNDLSNENNQLKSRLVQPNPPAVTQVMHDEEQIDIFASPVDDSSNTSLINTLFTNITEFINLEPKAKTLSTATANTTVALKAGVCLFLIFLSFGIFFQVGTGVFGKLPFATSNNFAGDDFSFRNFGSRNLLAEHTEAELVPKTIQTIPSNTIDLGPVTMDDVLMDEATATLASSSQVNASCDHLPRQSNF